MRIIDLILTSSPRTIVATLRQTPEGAVLVETDHLRLARELQRIPSRAAESPLTPEAGDAYLDAVLVRYAGSYLCAEERTT